RVHEMIAVSVLVTELKRLSLDLNRFDLVRRAEANIGALPCVDIADDRLDECAQISRGPMVDFQHDGGIAIVFDRHSSAKIVCRGHSKKLRVGSESYGARTLLT